MAITKKSAIISLCVTAVLVGGAVVGGWALKNKVDSIGSVDLATEEQKRLYVGAPKEMDGYAVKVYVRMESPFTATAFISLSDDDFNYNTGGQMDPSSHWCDLSSWAVDATGGMRLDEWSGKGGVIIFQSECAGNVSAEKRTNYGGGSYFVHAPEKDGSDIRVAFSPIKLQLEGEDIS